ncbi:hypothetical protein [Methylomagnum sp.]
MFKRVFSLPVALIIFLALGACAKQYKSSELVSGIEVGDTYYTQFSLFQEKNEFRTTNYRHGFLIPINTAATLMSINKKRIVLKLDGTGQQLTIENVPKHTNEDSQQAFKRIFGPKKVDLSRFTKDEKKYILSGEVKKGMRRDAVLAAIGYPPQNSTPSLSSDEWMYWSTRYDRFIVRFIGDQVAEIRN